LPKKEFAFAEVKDSIKKAILEERAMQHFKDVIHQKYNDILKYSNISGYITQTKDNLTVKEASDISENSGPDFITPEVRAMLVKMDKSEMSNLTLMNGKYYLLKLSIEKSHTFLHSML